MWLGGRHEPPMPTVRIRSVTRRSRRCRPVAYRNRSQLAPTAADGISAMNVLFVDDDAGRLAATRSFIQDRAIPIAAAFAVPDEVETHVERVSFDLVVAAVDSPSGEAAEALRTLATTHPELGRLVLSEYPEIAGHVPAHLVVPHRFDVDLLRRSMWATLRWRDRLGTARLAEIVTAADNLPSLPDAYVRIQEELASEDPSPGRVGAIVQEDPGIAVRVLKLVNSTLFGLRTEVGDVVQATTLVGMNTVARLVLAAGLFQATTPIERKFLERMWTESVEVATLARRIAQAESLTGSDLEETQVAGLLHDIGQIVFFRNWPDDYLEIDPACADASEVEIFGATHADVGAYLASLWALPTGVVEAIGYHHVPSAGRYGSVVSPTSMIHVARAFVDAGGDPDRMALDVAHVEEIGPNRVRGWLELLAPAAV